MLKSTSLLIVGAVIASVYFGTLSPAIAGGDSGEIVAEGCQLGTAHPPGYPLITVIIYILSKFTQFKTVSYRVNSFCALCTTVAGCVIGKIVSNMSSETQSGHVLSMGLFCLSPLIWQYAVTAEVFPLNTMFTALLLWLVQEFSIHRKIKYALIGAFVCGLALCNQHTIVLYEVPLILWMLVLLRKHIYRNPIALVQLSLCFILGLTPYLYLPISATLSEKAGSWGIVTTAEGFLHHVLRKDYGTFQLFSGASGRNAEGFWKRTEAYTQDFVNNQSTHAGAALFFVGLLGSTAVALWTVYTARGTLKQAVNVPTTPLRKQRAKPATNKKTPTETNLSATAVDDSAKSLICPLECGLTPVVFVLTQLFYFGVFHSLANLPLGDKLLFGVHQRFWMQPNVLMFVWVGLGYNYAQRALAALFQRAMGVGTSAVAANSFDNERNEIAHSGAQRFFKWGICVLGYVLTGLLVHAQYARWLPTLDYSDNYHFRNYATALLSPLPQNAVLLVNYDQQWTSIRYLQQCEGFRTDVTALQLSMMTYKWFKHKRELYPHLRFPGTYHTYPNSPLIASEGAFTLLSFLDSNVPYRAVFLGGKVNYQDDRLSAQYDMVPVGLVSRFLPFSQSPNGTAYQRITEEGWEKVLSALPSLPSVHKYGEDTWEWTIGRDFKDRVLDTASYMLLAALTTASTDPQPLVDAVYWLESSYLVEGAATPTSLLKNLGLAHVHMVQNPVLTARLGSRKKSFLPLPTRDLFNSLQTIEWPSGSDENWKIWSSNRFVHCWGAFLQRPNAREDAQYSTIKSMYETATKAAGK